MTNTVYYSEKQRFTQWWLWLILIGTFAIPCYGAISQLVLGKPFGDKPASDAELVILIVFIMLIIILLRSISLVTQITDEEIRCKLFPFHFSFHVYKWTDISNCYVRKYKPIREYGGWGIKYGFGGLAYNISGNMGIQLELNNGRRILIGTQQPEEVDRIIQQISKNKINANDH